MIATYTYDVRISQVHAKNMDHWTLTRRSTRSSFANLDSATSKYFDTLPPTTQHMSASKAEGRREDALTKQRNQMREDFERQKQTLINETEKSRPSSNRFVGQHDSMEESLKNSTVGLVRLEDFQQKRKELEEAKAREAARTNDLKYVLISALLLISVAS